MDHYKKFKKEGLKNIHRQSKDKGFKNLTTNWVKKATNFDYSYNFDWLGRPIIQYPQDIIILQEIVYKHKPDLIIETGIAHGGSLILFSSLLELLNIEKKKERKVIGIDIDIRKHNKKYINKHFLRKNIILMEGSSTDKKIIDKLKKFTKNKKVMVVLDSNHTHDHVLEELNLYSGLVSKKQYLVVMDTVFGKICKKFPVDIPWHKGNNQETALKEFLKSNRNFKLDMIPTQKSMITASPNGFLIKK